MTKQLHSILVRTTNEKHTHERKNKINESRVKELPHLEFVLREIFKIIMKKQTKTEAIFRKTRKLKINDYYN